MLDILKEDSKMQMTVHTCQTEHGNGYEFFLFSQTSPSVSWTAFRNREELECWLTKYKGWILQKDDQSIEIEVPLIHQVGISEKFFNLITDLTDLHCLRLFDRMLTLKHKFDKYRFERYARFVMEEGETLFNGRMTKCKRFFFFEEDIEVPVECIEVICRYKTVSADGKRVVRYQ
jgi:hypothetical protein